VGRPDATGDSHPAVIVHRLEESAEGCRWLLARWAELGNVVDCKAAWTDAPIWNRGKTSDHKNFSQKTPSTYRVTLADLTQISEFRTKEDLQWAAQFIASNSPLLGEVDPALLARIEEMEDESEV
jgi:hypothetical protein